MKKLIIKTILFTLVLSSMVFVVPQQNVYAGTFDTLLGMSKLTASGASALAGGQNQGNMLSQLFNFGNLNDLLNSAAATIANLAMAGAGLLLSMSAYILDVSIGLTLNIKSFVDATPAIYTVWKVIRDVTGLLFIFYLLYAAIQMMTGLGKGPSYGATIKNIVLAGILINFSFFMVSVSIDFSNVISQAIYQSMVPETTLMRINPESKLSEVVANAGKSNISNIFMNSLRIQKVYDANGNRLGTNIGDPIKILLIGIAGVIMMITTAASFILAALAFIARLVILIFLLAFSSVWFASMIIPQVKKHLNFAGKLFDQLIFMPVYLLLMYVGLTIINGTNLLGAGAVLNTTSVDGTNWIMPYIIIGVNFAIVIVILNLPLMVGLSMGGWATDWLKKSTSKWDAFAVWKNIGGWTGNKLKNTAAAVPQNTIGYGAYKLNKSATLGKIAASNPVIGTALSKGISKVSSATFGGAKGGYEGVLKARKKELDTMYKKLGDSPYKDAQKEFRTNLPTGILGHLVSFTANKEMSEKWIKDAAKKENKNNKPKKIKRLKEVERELANLEIPRAGFAAGTETAEERATNAKRKEDLEAEREKLEKDIQDAIELENSERDSKILNELGEIKEKGEKGGGDKGGDSKK